MKTATKLWIGLTVLILLTPLGLLAGGTAWGEWASEELRQLLGYVPEGLARLEGIWKSLLPDYSIPGWESPLKSSLGYILSAAIGVGAVVAATFLLGRFFSSGGRGRDEA